MLQQLKSPLSAEKKNPVRRLFYEQGDKSGKNSPGKEENLTKKSPVKAAEKKVIHEQK